MTRATIVGGAFAIMVVLLAIVFGYVAFQQLVNPGKPSAITVSSTEAVAHPDCLYGRIATADGAVYEGRLRWGQVQEAFWGDYFNGVKNENTWAAQVQPEQLLKEPRPI